MGTVTNVMLLDTFVLGGVFIYTAVRHITSQWTHTLLGQRAPPCRSSACLICTEAVPHTCPIRVCNKGHTFCTVCIKRSIELDLDKGQSPGCPSCRARYQDDVIRGIDEGLATRVRDALFRSWATADPTTKHCDRCDRYFVQESPTCSATCPNCANDPNHTDEVDMRIRKRPRV